METPNGRVADRSAMAIVMGIVDDIRLLIRKELELAREEIKSAVVARGIGAGVLAAAGVLAIFGLGFLALAVSAVLALFLPLWAALLIVALMFFGLAAGGALFAKKRIQSAPLVEETKRTIKEDVEWAKAHLGR
jgi:putative superfamily III holin-X